MTDLERYARAFANLRADAVPGRWPAATGGRAPYKPLLLLSVMDLMAQRVIEHNLISLNADLLDAFELYWTQIIGDSRESNPVMPFTYLRSEGFWHLVDQQWVEPNLRHVDRNEIFRQIKGLTLRARLDEELFTLLQAPATRDSLRRVLIERFFAPDARPTIAKVSRITTESFEYSRDLLNRSRGRFKLQEAPSADELYIADARSTAFRRVVVDAYNHTCAICRLRIVTPEGRTSVEAAHIVRWSYSHNDDPRNGMSLCRLHHWTFDQGLISVSAEYTVKVSPILSPDDHHTALIYDLDGAQLFVPRNPSLWPARAALQWHLANVFRAESPPALL